MRTYLPNSTNFANELFIDLSPLKPDVTKHEVSPRIHSGNCIHVIHMHNVLISYIV